MNLLDNTDLDKCLCCGHPVTTRGKLDPLVELTGSIRETLEHIREKAAAIRKALEAKPASTDGNSD